LKWTFLERDVTLVILIIFLKIDGKRNNYLENKVYNKISKKQFFDIFDDLKKECGGHLEVL